MFSKGKIDIILSKSNFAPGDIISGKVILTLKKPVKARAVNISLIGEQTTTHGGFSSSDKTTSKTRVYDFKQQLDKEKEYDKESEYNFEMKIPADILSRQPHMPQIGGALGQGFKIAQVLIGTGMWTNYYQTYIQCQEVVEKYCYEGGLGEVRLWRQRCWHYTRRFLI